MGRPGQGATAQVTRDALNQLFGINRTAFQSGVTMNNVITSINNGRPIIAGFRWDSNGHMVVINSFVIGSGWQHIGIMDPGRGFVVTNDTNPVSFVYSGNVWVSSSNIR